MRFLRWLLPLLALWALAFIIVWHDQIWWWIEIHTGTVHESGPYYGFFSGFGSDLAEYTLLGAVFNGIYLHWKHVNCHEPGCLRVGRHLSAAGAYKYCTRHFPGHPDGQMPSREHRVRLHWEHHAAQTGTSGQAD